MPLAPRDSPRLHPHLEHQSAAGAPAATWPPLPAHHGVAYTDPSTVDSSFLSQGRVPGTPETSPPGRLRPEGRYRTEDPSEHTLGLIQKSHPAILAVTGSDHSPGGFLFPERVAFFTGIRNWWQILKHSAEWLVSAGLLTDDKLPVPSGPKGYIMKAERHDQRGKPFASPENIARTNSQIDRHGSAATILRRALLLLKHCGQDSRAVYVRDTDYAQN